MTENQDKEEKELEKEIRNRIIKTKEGIDILKEPENVEEEVLNAIFLSNKKEIEEVEEDDIGELIEEFKQKIEQKNQEKK